MDFLAEKNKKYTFSIICAVIAILMLVVLRPILENPNTYLWITDILDEKKSNVTGLLVACTTTSTAITLIPGDVGTPIADQLADLSSIFLLILSFLYMEKYLLTLIGSITAWGIGICMILLLVTMWLPMVEINEKLRYISKKVITFVIILFCIIPISTTVSHMIDTTYETSIQETVNNAVESSEGDNVTGVEEKEEEKTIWESLTDGVSDVINQASEVASGTYEWAQNALNRFVEATAVMIVTSCVIPLLTLVIIVWMAKTILENKTGQTISFVSKQIPFTRKHSKDDLDDVDA